MTTSPSATGAQTAPTPAPAQTSAPQASPSPSAGTGSDTDWLDGPTVHKTVRSQIDTGFDTRKPVKLTSKQVAADPRMTDVQADKDLALAGAKKELAAELGHEPSKNELKKSDTYQREVETWKTTVKDTEDDIRGTEDGKVKDTTRQESIDNPGTPTIERETGKQVARKNFMAWAMDLMRDPEHPDLDVAAKV